jgi:hypothetical protein
MRLRLEAPALTAPIPSKTLPLSLALKEIVVCASIFDTIKRIDAKQNVLFFISKKIIVKDL